MDNNKNSSRIVQNSLDKSTETAVVQFTPEAMSKMLSLVMMIPKEVGWHGCGHKISKGKYQIDDIYLYPQDTTAATIRADDQEYADWQMKLAIEDSPHFTDLCFHGHSHVNMATVSSGTDRDLQDSIIEMLKNSERFYIFMIINKALEVYFKIADMEDKCIYESPNVVLNTTTGGLAQIAQEYIELVD